jgi:hypothetical protein
MVWTQQFFYARYGFESKDIQSRIDSGEQPGTAHERGDRSTRQSRRWRWSEGMMKMMGGGGGIAEMMKMMGGAGFGPTEDDDFVAPVSEASKKGKKALVDGIFCIKLTFYV